jgi:hypothetical protein
MVVDGHSNRGPLIRIYQLFVTTSSILPTIKTHSIMTRQSEMRPI